MFILRISSVTLIITGYNIVLELHKMIEKKDSEYENTKFVLVPLLVISIVSVVIAIFRNNS